MRVDLDVDTSQLKQQVKDLKQAAKGVVDKADAILTALQDDPLVVNVTPVAEPPPPVP